MPCHHSAGGLSEAWQACMRSSKWKNEIEKKSLSCKLCLVKVPDVWVCLQCASVGCGRNQNSHGFQHFQTHLHEGGHEVAINPVSLNTWCYVCDDVAETDESESSGLNIVIRWLQGDACLKTQNIVRNLSLETIASDLKPQQHSITLLNDALGKSCDSEHICSLGLQNLGNTCYMNATLQALTHCAPLVLYFSTCQAGFSKRSDTTFRLLDSFAPLIENLFCPSNKASSNSITPHTFVRIMRLLYPSFRGYSQQDAQEFLRALLDRLSVELEPFSDVYYREMHQYELFPTISQSARALDALSLHHPAKSSNDALAVPIPAPNSKPGQLGKSYPTIVTRLFEGTLKSQVTCLSCQHVSVTQDQFLDLSLPVVKLKIEEELANVEISPKRAISSPSTTPSSSSSSLFSSISHWFSAGVMSRFPSWKTNIHLTDCLYSFCAVEHLSGVNQFLCDHCHKRSDCQKSMKIDTLPEILCIHLKRFRYDSYFSGKINTSVTFPIEDLDMTPYRATNSGSMSATRSISQFDLTKTKKKILRKSSSTLGTTLPFINTDDDDNKYDLFALVCHEGGSVSGGHYLCYAKHPVSAMWHEYDDTYVRSVTEQQVKSSEAYLLFYAKKTPLQDKREKDAIVADFLDSPSSPSIIYISKLWWQSFLFQSTVAPHARCPTLLCPHGQVDEDQWGEHYKDLFVAIPESIYDRLVTAYGNSQDLSAVKSLVACEHCGERKKKIDERREKEELEVRELDRMNVSEGHSWYLISSAWLKQWHAFKQGAPLPGPVDNSPLFNDQRLPKPGLVKGRDYRGVNEFVWKYFVDSYGGGPVVCRQRLNLYDELINDKHDKDNTDSLHMTPVSTEEYQEPVSA